MKTRKESTPYKLNALVNTEIRDQFKQKCQDKDATGMSQVLRQGILQFVRGELNLMIDRNIVIDNTDSYRINMMVTKEFQDEFKKKCKEMNVSMSQWLKTFILYYINN